MRPLALVLASLGLALAAPGARAAGGPSALRLQAAGEPLRPGESVQLELLVLDAAGAPLDAPVLLDVDAGTVSAPERLRAGVYRATVTAPARLPASRSLYVLARAGALSADVTLPLLPGPPATLQLDGPRTCPEDAEACHLYLTARDASGNPAEAAPQVSAELGAVRLGGSEEPGRWVVAYRPPRVEREVEERVVVRVGPLEATHALKLVPARTRFGFGPSLGAVSQAGRLGFTAGARVVGERLVASGWLVGAGLEGGFWSLSWKENAAGVHATIDRSQLAVGLVILAERPLRERLDLGLSLGGGAVRVSSSQHVPGQPGVSDDGWAPTMSGALTLGYRLSVGMPFLEARGAWLGDAHLVTDAGARWPLFLQLGYRLDVR